MSEERTFTFTFSGEVTLPESACFPDGDVENPTVEDLLKAIDENWDNVALWIREWNLEDAITVTVTGTQTTTLFSPDRP